MDLLLTVCLGVIVVSLIGMLFSLYMMDRNERVWRYRRSLLDDMAIACAADERADRDWRWRFTAFEQVEYDEMVNKFWKPLDSFYEDMSFTNPTALDPNGRKAHLEAQSDMWPEVKQ